MKRAARHAERRLVERLMYEVGPDDMPKGAAPCVCAGDCAGRRHTCPRCLRFVPYCFGAADGLEEVCDDCFGQLHGTPAAHVWATAAREPTAATGGAA